LHVIDRHSEIAADVDRSGSIGVDAQENLLERLSQEEGERSKVIREQGRVFLNQLRARCEAHSGLQTDTRQRYGQLLGTLQEQESSVAMYVLGRRGESASHTRRDLGRHVEAICRQIRRPIMTVTDDFKAPKSVLVAYDGGRMTRRGIELLASNPNMRDLPIHVVMSGKQGSDAGKHLEWAEQMLRAAHFTVDAAFIPGDPEKVVTRAIAEREADLLIMGAYSHSPWRGLLLGSRTNDLLRASQVPTVTLHL
jgi:nucleotide-binding universal stress UspA family protein